MQFRTQLGAGLLLLVALSRPVFPQDAKTAYATPEDAAANPDFALQGEYANDRLGIQVVALGDDEFEVVTFRGGLPGAGWNGKDRQSSEEDGEAVRELIEDLELEKVQRTSPTIGAEPPRGAVVLFDGTEESLKEHWQDGARMTDDGLLMEGVTSRDTFRDFSLHIEFRLPFMPYARGQARGNSGIYYQGRYETQMLDSFGLEGKDNETGGIYEIRDPDLNMCLPPLTWQTYDVDFTAARYDDAGNKTANAKITVRLNGVVVHRDVEIPRITRAAPVKESPEPGPIYLQNHGNPVRYRNIWVLPRDAEKEARRPIVPGFERFYGQAGSDDAAGGRMLIGELGCVNCHAASKELAAYVQTKQAPILDEVGKRVRPEWALSFISDPHSTKPGTTMPALFDGWTDEERTEAATAIVNFLLSTGRISEQLADKPAAARGRRLFREVGCVACHAPREGQTVRAATTVPLPDFSQKYGLQGLADFLKNPHKVRPSGRMPAMNLDDKQARDLATYLLGPQSRRPLNPNLKFKAYHGSWDELPDFDELTPVDEGESAGLDVYAAGRSDGFGLRFEGYLNVEKEGRYRFHLGSDDGSALYIDGNKAIDVDGIHPHSVKTGRITLEPGVHAIRVDYFEKGGEESLTLEYEGPGIPRQDLSMQLWMTPEGTPEYEQDESEADLIVFDASQVETGRKLFASLGCASCHQLKKGGKAVASTLEARPLDQLDTTRGCLAADPSADRSASEPSIPQYDLSPTQQNALVAALHTPVPEQPAGPADRIHTTMVQFNCYACHSRGGVGGAEADRNPLFLSTIPEMGDEGRLPPPLDGIGDKLNDNWLNHVLDSGAKDRPYMRTKMPKFGTANVGHLTAAFAAADRRTEAEIPVIDEPIHRIKSSGRELVGEHGLACIKCHTFGNIRATGIQALDLQTMTKRLREDWFHRYLFDPPAYRPGTRMPTGFPNGQATVKDVYDGDPGKQIAAMWAYLKDGNKAGVPDGLLFDAIELKPTDRPVIYRNFLEGLTPRGIAVGYPEHCNLAWDANDLCLKLIWHGKFIDASKHWTGRGQGTQRPLGDHVLPLEDSAPVAVLASADTPWPTESARERGYRFRGYRLDANGRPTFVYSWGGGEVRDNPQPLPAGDREGTFERKITITAQNETDNVWFRAATGSEIEPGPDGTYVVDGVLRIRVSGGGEPMLRESAGHRELLVPVQFDGDTAELTQEILW
ncbi:family 16 glycoside hydrolase [Maioricimonas sp. JC845]|uniref:family 16 glycoside hydrolase n=1 Tax=Maioricimonas sp. JC845 TaxID=3232138 RepID=UPI003459965A